jgi:hypothetical protein
MMDITELGATPDPSLLSDVHMHRIGCSYHCAAAIFLERVLGRGRTAGPGTVGQPHHACGSVKLSYRFES